MKHPQPSILLLVLLVAALTGSSACEKQAENKPLYTPMTETPVAPAADPATAQRNDYISAYMEAARLGDLAGLEAALAYEIPVDVKDEEDLTALLYATNALQAEAMRFLLENGADANLAAGNGITPLMLAIDIGTPAMAELLLKHGAEVNRVDERGRSALMYAANRGYLDKAKLLIKHKADLSLQTEDGETALSRAKENGHTDVAAFLESAQKTSAK